MEKLLGQKNLTVRSLEGDWSKLGPSCLLFVPAGFVCQRPAHNTTSPMDTHVFILRGFVCLSLCINGCLFVCLSLCIIGCLFVCLSLCIIGCLFVCLYVSLVVCLFVFLYQCLFLCLLFTCLLFKDILNFGAFCLLLCLTILLPKISAQLVYIPFDFG